MIERQLGRALPDDILNRSRDLLFDRFHAGPKPIDGVEDAIAALPYRRCVASSSAPDRLHLALEVSGLAPLFGDDVFSATQVAHGKPAPDLFLFAARMMNAEPAHCIVIEDSTLGSKPGLRPERMRSASRVGVTRRTRLRSGCPPQARIA